jgi:acyl-CoA reductase-like NAD-dependent aldehyde dehydrogenase
VTVVYSSDPTTGVRSATSIDETTPAQLEAIAARATGASRVLATATRDRRADLLLRIADTIDATIEQLCRVASAETALPHARLRGEVTRASAQFRLFADVVRDGAFMEAMIDHPDGADGPDIRRMLVPVGPVAVFGASNFPFAFSVLGGDTASALAAGCAVIVKAHPAHPLTSEMSGRLLQLASNEVIGEPDLVQLVYGFEAGISLVKAEGVRAASLTGSIAAARALQGAIDERPEPIPFFAELGSVNPLVLLEGAARARPAQIATGLVASFTGSSGQLCTKPGYAFIPIGAKGDLLVDAMRLEIEAAAPATLLAENIRDAFVRRIKRLEEQGAKIEARSRGDQDDQGFVVPVTLLEVHAAHMDSYAAEECFGPALVIVRYRDEHELANALRALPASLTLTIHAEPEDRHLAESVLESMIERTGRVIFNGYPTGVRVSWGQHHGGPWPSTNSQHTSVGATAVRRFLRPIAFQNAPAWALPVELRDTSARGPLRVDGALSLR